MAKFGLTLHAKKTRLIEFGRFAANNARRGARQAGNVRLPWIHTLLRHHREGSFRSSTDGEEANASDVDCDSRKALSAAAEPVPIVGGWLQRVLNGYFAYHAVPTNLLRLNGFRSEVCRAWRHALLRRSQRHRLNWVVSIASPAVRPVM